MTKREKLAVLVLGVWLLTLAARVMAQDSTATVPGPIGKIPVTPVEWQLMGGMVIGWLVQKFARAPKSVPTWVSYAAIGVAGVGVYIWITPAFGKVFAEDWRSSVAGLVSFLFQIRGQAGASADAKVAPSVDTK